MTEKIQPDESEIGNTSDAKVEAEQKTAKLIWFVDDNSEIIGSIMRMARITPHLADIGADFKHFKEGEEAINEFVNIIENGGQLPTIILMDYRLNEEVNNPKYELGADVIAEIKRIADAHEIAVPEIIAFSSQDDYAQELLSAGATASIKKSDYSSVKHFFETL